MTDDTNTNATAPKRTRTRKAKVASDPLRDAFMATATPAQAARVIGMDGKAFRTILRGKLNVHVRIDPSSFDADAHARMWELTAKQRAAKDAAASA